MANTTVTVTGTDAINAKLKADALQDIANKLDLDELQKLQKMASPKGRKALKEKWGLISKFI